MSLRDFLGGGDVRTLSLGSGGLKEITSDRLYRWPCKNESCVDCEEQYVPYYDQYRECMLYNRALSDSEASEVARRLVLSAKANRAVIQQRLAQHGDNFMRRWKKRSKDKRAEILLHANANLPELAGAYFQLTQANGGDYNWRHSRTPKYRFAALLPYLDISTLRDNPAVLFALLHYRTEYTFEDWASFDMYQTRDSWKIGLFALDFSPLCVVLHGEQYGEVVPFQADAAHRGDILGFPRARLLLGAQADLMKFLRRVIDATLEGANLENHASAQWTAMCHDGFKLSGDVVQWSTYTNQPFSPPPLFDIEAIISTAKLRFNAVADHLALLQTEPAYLRRYIRSAAQGEAYKSGPLADVFGMIDGDIALDATSMYWWLCIKDEAEHVRDVQRRFRDQIRRGASLPPEYDRALASLELVLVNQMNIRGDLGRREVQQRPGFARYYRFEALPNHMLEIKRTDTGPLANKLQDDPMYWCLMNLSAKPDEPTGIDHAQLFRFLEAHLAKAPAAEKARLDQVIVDHLSDYAANHQLLLAVRLHRPQNSPGDSYEMVKTENRRAWRKKHPTVGSFEGGHPARGALLKRFYQADAPGGRRDAAWIEQSQKVRKLMGTYWSSFRNAATDHMADEEAAPYMRADLDPEHLAALEKERQTILDDISLRRAVPSQPRPLLGSSESAQATSELRPAKVKAKTRSDAAEQPDDMGEAPDKAASALLRPSASTGTIPSVLTTKRAFDTFSKMYTGDAEGASKGTDWDQFVHCMKDVGFVVRNGAGSAVVFDLLEKGKIVFHRPHPVAKIDPILLRAMGKRMAKWFGWCRESFVLDAA